MTNFKNTKAYKTNDTEKEPLVSEPAVVYHATPFSKVHFARKGVSPKFVSNLMVSYNLNKTETARLTDISTKTLERHMQSGKPFTGLQSDRLIELADLFEQGVETFGNRDKFIKWLNSEIPALGNHAPKDFLDTQKGIEIVSDEIGRIKHGIFA